MPNTQKQLDWVSGEFIRGSQGHVCLKTGDLEIPIENGMAIEAAVKPEVTYTGITGIRNDALYFMGRSPMFALPIDLLLGNSGRIGRSKSN